MSPPHRHSLEEIFVPLGCWLLYDGNNYFVMPTDDAAAPRIIYCLCERRDCRNPRDRNPPRIVGAGTLARSTNVFLITFRRLRINYDGIASAVKINTYLCVTSNLDVNEVSLVYARMY